MYTKIILAGNLGGDPVMRYTPGGDAVTSFSLAVNKSWTKDGVKQERTTWYRVTAWRKLGETVAQYLHKGSKVLVECDDLEAKTYQNKAGEWVASVEVTASGVRFLDSKGEAAETTTNGAPAHPATQHPGNEADIPF